MGKRMWFFSDKKNTVDADAMAATLQNLADALVHVHKAESGVWQIMVDLDVHRTSETTEVMRTLENALHKKFNMRPEDYHLLISTHRAAPELGKKAAPARKPSVIELRGVKKIIVVASGKGGVGKSTVAANLACALALEGLNVGLLDADIYGPSVPRLMGLSGQKPDSDKDGRIVPLRAHNVAVMSIGFMVDETQALIWRGPMVQSAFKQLLADVAWNANGDLDVLVLDTPPGTGDIQLTLAQSLSIDGAVIVSTSQDLALADARKGVMMFQKLNVPIFGVVENMSIHHCSNCGHKEAIFDTGGAKRAAAEMNVAFLGELPLGAAIRIASDRGKPIVLDETLPEAAAFRVLGKKVNKLLVPS